MLTFGTPDPQILDTVRAVVGRLENDTGIWSSQVMVVGAHARDAIHSGLGRAGFFRATDDVDLALALSGWDAYQPVTKTYTRLGDSDMRYAVDGVPVDFLPFGPHIEEPPGTVTPPPRKEGWTVAGFQDVYNHSQTVRLTPRGNTVQVPSPAGYTALKLRSWADRAANYDTKDARDLALACSWYTSSTWVEDQLYNTAHGQKLLENCSFDQELAAVGFLSHEVAAVFSHSVKTDLASDLRAANRSLLAREFTTSSRFLDEENRSHRESLISALLSAIV